MSNIVIAEKITPLSKIFESNLPQMQRSHDLALEALNKVTAVNTEDDYQSVNNLLIKVKKTYELIQSKRKEITAITDAIKEELMQYERPFDDDARAKDSVYLAKKKLLIEYKQKILDEQKKKEEEAARKKEKENRKVDLTTKVKANLNNLMLAKIKYTDDSSRDYLTKSTVESIDARGKAFLSMKPKLKDEEYNQCFNVLPPGEKDQELIDHVNSIKQVETFDKWNEEMVKLVAPTLNEWRAKIPQIKKELQELAAADDAQKKALEEQRLENERIEKQRKEDELKQIQQTQQDELDNSAQVEKMHNSFQEQATIQSGEDAGTTKKVLKLTDPTNPTPIAEIIMQCMVHPKFPGIIKTDKSKKQVTDDKGRPEYVPAVQWWINFFTSNCDADIKGTLVLEDAKVTIRQKAEKAE